jgi:hypothetical protein
MVTIRKLIQKNGKLPLLCVNQVFQTHNIHILLQQLCTRAESSSVLNSSCSYSNNTNSNVNPIKILGKEQL